jgi:hypothetical protein
MATNLLDILMGTQIGAFTTIYSPTEVKITILSNFQLSFILYI